MPISKAYNWSTASAFRMGIFKFEIDSRRHVQPTWIRVLICVKIFIKYTCLWSVPLSLTCNSFSKRSSLFQENPRAQKLRRWQATQSLDFGIFDFDIRYMLKAYFEFTYIGLSRYWRLFGKNISLISWWALSLTPTWSWKPRIAV